MRWFRTIAGMVNPRIRAEETVKEHEVMYQKVSQASPELDPHDHLAQVWLARTSAAGHNIRNLDLQTVAYRVTKQFACVPSPECVRALAIHTLTIEDEDSFHASPRFQKELAILMTSVSHAKEKGTLHELYARYNPNRAAEIGIKKRFGGTEGEGDSSHDQEMADYDKAIELDPNDARAYLNRGYTYKEQGKKVEAIADFEKYLTLTESPSEKKVIQRWIEELSK